MDGNPPPPPAAPGNRNGHRKGIETTQGNCNKSKAPRAKIIKSSGWIIKPVPSRRSGAA
jgi:hypothetical protein